MSSKCNLNIHAWGSFQSSFLLIVVTIENHSSYDLEYVASGTQSGYSSVPMMKVFGTKKQINGASYHVLEPGSAGRNCWQERFLEGFPKALGSVVTLGMLGGVTDINNVCGWFSVRVRCPGKDHIVCCGFRTATGTRPNGAGIQIRGEDGVLDGGGNIAGHGTTPTGAVTDAHALATMHLHHGVGKAASDQIQEEARALRVHCEFDNHGQAYHIFKFYDGAAYDDEGIQA